MLNLGYICENRGNSGNTQAAYLISAGASGENQMSMKTNLSGRLRNTSLPANNGLMPLFEAVVNSIHSIEELSNDMSTGSISVEIVRSSQGSLDLKKAGQVEKIVGFKITDTGVGFNDLNMKSFETLDTDHKADKGCRGVGRLLWLKAFKRVNVQSVYQSGDTLFSRAFTFNINLGINDIVNSSENISERKTTVELQDFSETYRVAAPKTLDSISKSLLEHCLWYFVREGGAPAIVVKDGADKILLDELYDEYMHDSAQTEEVEVYGESFSITHIKFRASSAKSHALSFCATNRLVKEEALNNKIPGLYGSIADKNGGFVYSCYVSSPYLDEKVRSERTGFNIEENAEGLFEDKEISLKKIREVIYPKIKAHLQESLKANIDAGKERVEKFVAEKAPRYRPIISRISEDDLIVDSSISDKDLDIHLHKQLAKLERSILEKGHNILVPLQGESSPEYYARVRAYLEDVSDMKKSDLADYLCHRRVIIDLLEDALKQDSDGKYVTEDIIHELIMPMRKDSNDIFPESCNLWLLDENLAFHDYLASDKTINAMPISQSSDTKEPDILALNVYDNPILTSEGDALPLASIVVVEIKRPMRNDARAGEDKDPIEQALGYLKRVRDGKAQTPSGRPIPNSTDIPGYCYIVCDLTESVQKRCDLFNLTISSDRMGYFGYNSNYKAYIEVISFDKLIDSAKKRNKAFFDKLGLPTT